MHLPVANEQLDMAAPQQANMMIHLPESQLALSSLLSDTEAATVADELHQACANLTSDGNHAIFPPDGIDFLKDLLQGEESGAATQSDSWSRALLTHGATLSHAHACFTSTYVCKHSAALHASSSPMQGNWAVALAIATFLMHCQPELSQARQKSICQLSSACSLQKPIVWGRS